MHSALSTFHFADFHKGLDLIGHKILLQKSYNFNLHWCLVRWVAGFFYREDLSLSAWNYLGLHLSTLMAESHGGRDWDLSYSRS